MRFLGLYRIRTTPFFLLEPNENPIVLGISPIPRSVDTREGEIRKPCAASRIATKTRSTHAQAQAQKTGLSWPVMVLPPHSLPRLRPLLLPPPAVWPRLLYLASSIAEICPHLRWYFGT